MLSFIQVTCLFLLTSIFTYASGVFNETGEIVSVVVIFRHGDRVIINPYPKDPYRNVSYWPAGWGQLTNKGKMQQYKLGQWLRNRYKDLLPVDYSEKDIYVRSTDVDRTLMSAEANLAGLYPPHDKQIWDTQIPWQPIPIHTSPEAVDSILAMKKPCPKYNLLFKKLKESPEIVEINRKNRDLYDYVSENAGTKVDSIEHMEYIYNTLSIERLNNYTLPAWTDPIYPEKMKPIADFSFALPCYNEQLARLKAGPFFHELLDNFLNATVSFNRNKSTRKLWIYSGHDTTVANILQSLRIFQTHSPPLTSTIIFETHHVKGNYYVNILYKNSSVLQRMVLNGCDFDCPMQNFVKCLQPLDLAADKRDEECKLDFRSVLQATDNGELIIAVVMLLVCVFILAIVTKVLYGRFRKTDDAYLRLPNDENV